MLARTAPPEPKPGTPVSPGWLLAVACAVLLVHLLVLNTSQLALSLVHNTKPGDQVTLSFNTRRIDPAPASPTSAPARQPVRPVTADTPSRAGRTLPALNNAGTAADAPSASRQDPPSAALEPGPQQDLPSASSPSSPAATPTPLPVDPTVGGPTDAVAALAAPGTDQEGRQAIAEAPYDPNIYRFLPPPSVRMNYQVQLQIKGFSQSATAEMRWSVEGSSYTARLEVRHWLAGSRMQTSTGQITTQGLAPTRFSDKVRSEVAAHFERDKGLVSFSANTPSAPLLPGMQDRLSVFMQLASLLAAAPESMPTGTRLVLPVAGPRAADLWSLTVEGPESLNLPGGALSAIKLVRLPQKEYDQKLELWLAPSMGFLPVRIRLTDANGDVADQLWQANQ